MDFNDTRSYVVSLYNGVGSDRGPYDFSGTYVSTTVGLVKYLVYEFSNIEDGIDGILLWSPPSANPAIWEFLSYEGSFTATGGLASGKFHQHSRTGIKHYT